MLETLCVIATSFLGYLIGSLSPAIYVASRKKVNLLDSGTHNPGTMNVAYNVGVSSAAVVLVLDVLKTVIPYWIARMLNPALDWAGPLAGAMTLVGHIFPCWHGFKGGRGLACLVGLALASFPLLYCVSVLAVSIVVSLVTRGSRWAILLGCLMAGVGVPLFVTEMISIVILIAAVALVFGQNIPVVRGLTPGSDITSDDVFRKKDRLD